MPDTALAARMLDLAAGINQQMYYWGRDVLHAGGNLLVRNGFTKRPSTGLQGTSCYALPWRGGHIELHGSHAGWFRDDGGFLFIRPRKRCVLWTSPDLPVPGVWPEDHLVSKADSALHAASVPFIDWWLAYESAIAGMLGPGYRSQGYSQYRKLPKTRSWLPPREANAWITAFRENPSSVRRAKDYRKIPI
jgi:hypothetical protein